MVAAGAEARVEVEAEAEAAGVLAAAAAGTSGWRAVRRACPRGSAGSGRRASGRGWCTVSGGGLGSGMCLWAL